MLAEGAKCNKYEKRPTTAALPHRALGAECDLSAIRKYIYATGQRYTQKLDLDMHCSIAY